MLLCEENLADSLEVLGRYPTLFLGNAPRNAIFLYGDSYQISMKNQQQRLNNNQQLKKEIPFGQWWSLLTSN